MSDDAFNAAMLDRVLRPGRTTYYQENLGSNTYVSGAMSPPIVHPTRSNLVGSKYGDKHLPVIDLDMPCVLLDSSTPGHHHLYIDREVDEDKYFKLLDALVDAGLVQRGFAWAARKNGQTYVRKPGVRKGAT
jgi:hypothetical protein